MKNVFTVDVEDYFQVQAFAGVIDPARWDDYQPRVVANTKVMLELLAERGVTGTFFVLGWVAKRSPGLVRQIVRAGHEIASHGMNHRMITTQSAEVFRSETRDSKKLLEDLCQQPVIGYRAATYSITEKSTWALDILCEEDFKYDSSIFPMRHDYYGIPDANPLPHRLTTPNGSSIAEFPISVLKRCGLTIPVAGGGYFRLLPYRFTRWALRELNTSNQEFVFYIHPWEVDADQPRIERAGLVSRFRHYQNLKSCSARLRLLLEDFEFTTMRDVLMQKGLLAPVA